MNYYHDIWIGYLTEIIVRKTVETCINHCSGCRDKLKSPLLHLHHQYSLLDKLHLYINEIRGNLVPIINSLYNDVSHKLPHSDDLMKDKELYTNNARFFLTTSSPESLYFGRYISENNDCIIEELLTPKKKRKILQPKRPTSLNISKSDNELKKLLINSEIKKRKISII